MSNLFQLPILSLKILLDQEIKIAERIEKIW